MTLIEAIMSRDSCDRQAAEDLIEEMRDLVFQEGEDPESVLYEYGFEPDYLDDLINIDELD